MKGLGVSGLSVTQPQLVCGSNTGPPILWWSSDAVQSLIFLHKRGTKALGTPTVTAGRDLSPFPLPIANRYDSWAKLLPMSFFHGLCLFMQTHWWVDCVFFGKFELPSHSENGKEAMSPQDQYSSKPGSSTSLDSKHPLENFYSFLACREIIEKVLCAKDIRKPMTCQNALDTMGSYLGSLSLSCKSCVGESTVGFTHIACHPMVLLKGSHVTLAENHQPKPWTSFPGKLNTLLQSV